MKCISLIGSTGSIGTQALDVARERGYKIAALCAGENIDLLEAQAREFAPQIVSLKTAELARELEKRLSGRGITVLYGQEGACTAAACENADIVLNSFVGIAGLRPTIAAIGAHKTLALANKESLICAGELVMDMAKRNNIQIIPVDSEHSAVFQALKSGKNNEVRRIILTASGGPFFGKTQAQMQEVRPSDALKHPSWSMGAKITIDSATMMNKGFEIMEAAYLFDVPPQKIEVTVHRESVVHSLVEFCDGSVIAQLSPPDMRLPIQYAIDYDVRVKSQRQKLDFSKLFNLSFCPPDDESFPAMDLCRKAFSMGGNGGAIINGANEAAVARFLQGQIKFTDITKIAQNALDKAEKIKEPTIEQIFESDKWARCFANNY